MPATAPLRVIIDGNIGAGKSVLLEALAARLRERGFRVAVNPEKVSAWESLGLLQALYDGSLAARHRSIAAAAFQVLGPLRDQLTFARDVQSNGEVQVILQERCLDAARYVFLPAAVNPRYAATQLDEDHAAAVFDLYDMIVPAAPQFDTLRICLRCPAAICAQRVAGRARDAEATLACSDLEVLREYYDAFWATARRQEKAFFIDATLPPERVADVAASLIV